MKQFSRFCVVGTAGFVIDAGILQLLIFLAGMNSYFARVLSFLAAATATWALNRRFTFSISDKAAHGEWMRYTTFMTMGAAVNYCVFALLVYLSAHVREQPWLGVAAGSLSGLVVNFSVSKLLVFRNA